MPFSEDKSIYLCDCNCGQETNRKPNGDWNRYIVDMSILRENNNAGSDTGSNYCGRIGNEMSSM
jgi:hypothetical protein